MGEIENRDIALVQGTWAKLMEDEVNSGVCIVKTFIDRFDYYSSFVRFKDHPRETIEQNQVFRAHCTAVMRGLNAVISNLHDPQKMKEILENLGRSHGRRSIKKEQFENLIIVVMDLLDNISKITNDEHEAWQRVLNSTFAIIEQNL